MKSNERRMKLILMLQQNKKRLTVQDLADRFDVSRRTIFRDFNVLSEINVPVTWDKYSGYGIMRGYTVPPLMFTSKELATIMVGLGFAKSQVNKTLAEDARGVALKIKEVLPDELKGFMSSLEERTVVDPFLRFGTEKTEGGHWYLISSAISQSKRIQFEYKSKSDKQVTKREVDPYLIVFFQDHWNMIGYSHKREAVRNFVLERMSDIVITEKDYTIPGDVEIEDLIFRPDESAYLVEVEVDKKVLQQFEANLPAKVVRKEKAEKKRVIIQFYFDNLDYINKWLLQFPLTAKIKAPNELKKKRKKLLDTMIGN